MRKLLTTLTFLLMGAALFAQKEDLFKHARYGTVEQHYPPVESYINPDYSPSSRSTDVTIVCDGGSWQGEVSWDIVDANGDTVASGGAPFSGSASLDTGVYTAYGHDSYGDGWNGNYLTVSGTTNGVTYLSLTLTSGLEDSATFEITEDIPGCMTASACNYNSEATVDDGSCCVTNCSDIVVGGGSYMGEVSWEIVDASGDTVVSGGAPYDEFQCFDDGDYNVYGHDSYGDGWNGNTLVITDSDGNVVLEFTLTSGDYAEASFSLPLPADLTDVFFSEYAEGSSNNKYLEIYNGTDATISLDNFIILGNYNGNSWSEAFTFASGAILESGDVYVLANASASDAIQALADEVHAYGDPWYTLAFNGDDVRALCEVSGTDTTILDIIGTLDGDGDGVPGEGSEDDPGSGFDVAGVANATKDHTLVRKNDVVEGNGGDWESSAGTNADDSEWLVEERPTADYTPPTLGWHMTPPCDGNQLTFHMYDSYGDSWNGNTYAMVDSNGDTVATGGMTTDNCSDGGYGTYDCNYAADDLCLDDGSYTMTVGGGSYMSEVGWDIIDTAGDTLYTGGAPYSGVVSFGETSDVPGCTDPDAINYDAAATFDDGSCYYAGDSCNIALDATAGENYGDGDDEWFTYTATLDGNLTISSQNETGDAAWDTRLYVHTGTCDDLTLIAQNDDCCDYYGPSIVEIECVTGATYTIFWDDQWGPGPFTWTLEETLPPTGPTNLVAEAGMEEVYLSWDPAPPAPDGTFRGRNILDVSTEAYMEKRAKAKSQQQLPEINSNTLEELQERYGSSARDASVYFVLHDSYGDGYGGNGYITSSAGDTVFMAPGGGWGTEAAYGPILLGTGDYTVSFEEASWQSETTWDVLQAATGTVIATGGVIDPVDFNVADGGDVSLADLSVSIEYVEAEENLYFHLYNTGAVGAYGFSLDIYLGEVDANCGNENADFSAFIDVLAAGDTASLYLSDPVQYFGDYGTYNVGAFADVNCVVDESDETNNAVTSSVTFTDPNEGIVWNIYRQTGDDDFATVGSVETDPEYLDTLVTGDVEYCYYVTQVLEDGTTETESSNHACATPESSEADLCPPTNLVAEAGISEVFLMWDAPGEDGEAANSLSDPQIANTAEMNAGRERLLESVSRPTPRACWNYNEAWAYLWYGAEGIGRASIFELEAGEWSLDSVTIYDYSNAWVGFTSAEANVDIVLVDENGNSIEGGLLATGTLVTDGSFGSLGFDAMVTMEEAGLVKVVVTSLTNAGDVNSDGVDDFAPFLLSDDGSTPSGMTGTDDAGTFTGGVYNWDLELCATLESDFSCGTFSHYSVLDASGEIDTTSYEDYLVTGLTNGQEYCYTVIAVYDEGNSEASNEACAIPGVCPPTNLVAEAGDTDVYLMWDAPAPSGETANALVNPQLSNSADMLIGQERLLETVDRPTQRACWNYNESWAYLWYGAEGIGRASIFWFDEGEWLLESVAVFDYSNAWVGLTEASATVDVVHVDENGNSVEGGLITTGTLTTDGTYGEIVFDETFFNMEEAGLVKVVVTSLTNAGDVNSDGVDDFAPFLLSDDGSTPSGMTGTDDAGVFTLGDYNWDLELCALSEEDLACGTFSHYNVYGAAGLIDTTTFEDYLVEGLTNGETYCFTVTAEYDEGESVASNEACATPEAPVGTTCAEAEPAVAGTNFAPQQPYWAYYDATMDGFITVSSYGAGDDTHLFTYDGDCENLNLIASDDDGWGYPPGESIVEFASVAGTRYYIEWRDTWSDGAFEWTLEEILPPTSPTNLTATEGVGSVSLMWDPIPGGSRNAASMSIAEAQALTRNKEAKKQRHHIETETPGFGAVHQDYASNSRSTDVTIICDGGTWQSEVSWEILDEAGTVVAEGGAPIELTASLDNGVYTVNGYDSYGDGWNGNFLTVTGTADGALWFNFTILDGDFGTGTLTMGDTPPEAANLNLSDLHYSAAQDAIVVTMHNTGGLIAYDFYLTYYWTNETSDECQNGTYDDYAWADYMDPDSSFTFPLPGALELLGYGTHDVGMFIDWACTVDESNEEDNTITTTIEIINQNEGVVWNIYRQTGEDDFAQIGSVETEPSYVDTAVVGEVEYCYYVTQILEDDSESDTSNHACAIPIAPVDLPTPTELVGEADGWTVNLSWTDPDIGGGGGETEDFEDGALPDGWDMTTNAVDCADLEAGWFITMDGTSAYWAVPAGDGYYACSNDDACNSDGGVDYLYMPEADFSGGAQALTFRSFYTAAYSQTAHILVSVDGGTSYEEVAMLEGNSDWVDEYVDLSAYDGEGSVQIVFWSNDNATWASGWAVDNITLGSPQDFYLLHYNVYSGSEGSEEYVASTMVEEFSEFQIDTGTYTYSVTAVYEIYGESDPSNYVDVLITGPEPQCNPPRNLVAESNSNDVSLSWEAPEGGPGWNLHHDSGEWGTSIGTNGEADFSVAARFGPEHLMDYDGMSLTKVQFIPNEPSASYQVSVWAAEVDGPPALVDTSEWISGADLTMGEYNVVDLAEGIEIDWTAELWFGYRVVTPTGYPAGTDPGPAYQWYGDLLLWDGEWISMAEDFGLDYNWALQGFVDFAGGGRSIASMPIIDLSGIPRKVTSAEGTFSHMGVVLPPSNQVNTTRVMTNYIVYRDGEALDSTGVDAAMYNDNDAPWGPHAYYVTALYNNSEDCGESDPSNTVEVDLFNNPPGPFMLIEPVDGMTLVVMESNLGDMFPFIWTTSTDPDNDPVSYVVVATDTAGGMYDTTSATAGLFLTNEDIAGNQIEDSVAVMTYVWDVWAHDPWDSTSSDNGPMTFTVDISTILALDDIGLPEVFALYNNYPNPFNPVTNITYDIPEVAQVTLDVYNIAGQKVRTLAQGLHEPGRYRIQWNATNDYGKPLSSGMYIYRIHAGDFVSVKKLILMK